MNTHIYYYLTGHESGEVHRIISTVPDSYVRSLLLDLGKLEDKTDTGFIAFLKTKLLSNNEDSPMAQLNSELTKDITLFVFPTGIVWIRNKNAFDYENMERYRHLDRLYKQQQAIADSKPKENDNEIS